MTIDINIAFGFCQIRRGWGPKHGWIYQERALAPRVLHFTKYQVLGVYLDGSLRAVIPYRTPSWSWASIDGMVICRNWNKEFVYMVDVLNVAVRLRTSDQFGDVSGGFLCLYTKLGRGAVDKLLEKDGFSFQRLRQTSVRAVLTEINEYVRH
jgi:hypothetical protein